MGLFTPRSTAGAGSLSDILASKGIDLSVTKQEPPSGLGLVPEVLKNAVGDVVEIGQGMASLIATPIHDVFTAGADLAEALPGAEKVDREYRTDDLLKNLVFDPEIAAKKGLRAAISPGLQTYGEQAYGVNPLKGDLLPDVKKVGRSLYENPVSTALDVWGGAVGAGAVAQKAALSSLARTGKAGAMPWVKRVLPGVDEASDLYDASGRNLGGALKRLRESGDPTLDIKPLSKNPVRRKVQQGVHRILSQDIRSMPDDLKRFVDELDRVPKDDAAVLLQRLNAEQPDFARQVQLYQKAKELGVARLEHPKVAEFRLKNEAKRLVSSWSALVYSGRNEDMVGIERILTDNLSETELPHFYKVAQGMPVKEGTALRRIKTPGRRNRMKVAEFLRDPRAREVVPFYDEAVSYFGDIDEQIARLTERHKAAMRDSSLSPEDKAAELASVQSKLDAWDHYAEQLSERLTVAERGGQVDRMAKAVAEIRWKWHPLMMESIKRGLIDDMDTVQARMYAPLLIERKAPRLQNGKLDETSFKWEELSGENPDYWKMLRDEFNDKQNVSPLYYPHIDPMKFSKGDLVLRRGRFMEKMTGKAPFKYNQYWNYVNGRYLMDDPVEALARRAAHVRRVIEVGKFSERIADEFGIRVTKMDQVPEGFSVFNPKMMKQIFRTRTEMDEAVSTMKSLGMTDERALSEALRDVSKRMAAEADLNGMDEVYAIPEVVAKELESYSKYQIGDMGRVWWDGPTNVWRGAVLAFSPRWIINNLLGNVTFLKMQGGHLTDVFRDMFNVGGFRDKVDAFISRLPEDAQAQINSGLFSEAQQYRTRLGGAERTVGGTIAKRSSESQVGRKLGGAREWMERRNEWIEHHFRRASFLRGLDRERALGGFTRTTDRWFRSQRTLEDIAKSGVDEKVAWRAIDELNYFLNDYRRLSSFERNVVKRFIAPFYSFYRHTAKLTLSYPFKHPERATVWRLMGELSREMDEELGPRPHWLTGSVPVGEGTVEGETRFLNTRGANPLGGFTQTLADPKSLFGMMGPQLQGAYEMVSGKDALTQRPFTSPEVGGAFGSEDQYQAIYDDEGNLVSVSDEPKPVRPGVLEQFIRAFPQTEMLRDVASWVPYPGNETPYEVGERYGTGEERMEAGELAAPRSVVQEIAQLLGVSTTDFDLESYQERQEENRKAAAVQILRALGEVPPPEEED